MRQRLLIRTTEKREFLSEIFDSEAGAQREIARLFKDIKILGLEPLSVEFTTAFTEPVKQKEEL